tara:strand:- start:420 stop:620 length:201 start_codon:yes stop_codon:yes gene_type:complete
LAVLIDDGIIPNVGKAAKRSFGSFANEVGKTADVSITPGKSEDMFPKVFRLITLFSKSLFKFTLKV